MVKECAVCGEKVEWQGALNPCWVHIDERLDTDHAGVYVPPSWSGCCGAVTQ